MENATFAILLLMLAQTVIISEVFLPSGGILGILATIIGLASLFFAYQAWFSSNNEVFWVFVASSAVLPMCSVSIAFYLLPRTRLGKRILLEAPTREEVTPYADEEIHLKQLVGQVGRADTLLAPGGFVVVGNERHHCVTQGGSLIDRGESVEIVAVNANRLMVRRYVPRESSTIREHTEKIARLERDGVERDVVQRTEPSLDFEIPESEMNE
ncbi:MAG: hypothetical protein O3A00_17445 [Planctomycetota bacterium]|nr:hypothetical protein [Planctomycetota bacterium]